MCTISNVFRLCIYDPGSRFANTPSSPPRVPHGMVPKPAFCSILHEHVVFAAFFGRWVAGAVRKPANPYDFLQTNFRQRVNFNVSASTSWSRALAAASMSNYLTSLFSSKTLPSVTDLVSVYILRLLNFLLE